MSQSDKINAIKSVCEEFNTALLEQDTEKIKEVTTDSFMGSSGGGFPAEFGWLSEDREFNTKDDFINFVKDNALPASIKISVTNVEYNNRKSDTPSYVNDSFTVDGSTETIVWRFWITDYNQFIIFPDWRICFFEGWATD